MIDQPNLDNSKSELGTSGLKEKGHVVAGHAISDDDRGDILKYDGKSNLLEPQPSNDPHDPLNFPSLVKVGILAVLGYWAFLGTANLIIVGPSFLELATNYQTSITSLSYTINGPLVAYGVGCLIWVPFSNIYGIRLTFMIASSCAATLSIWAALAPSFEQFVAARVLSSVFYAAPEALGPQIVTDVFFLHQRATATSAFTLLQFLGFSFAGLIGGYATSNQGWRAPSWVMVIMTFIAFIGITLLLPETNYTRAGRITPGEKRGIADMLSVRSASGGGGSKVKSKRHAFLQPWYYLPHPVVLLTTSYFSMFLATNDYMLTTNPVSFPTRYGWDLKDLALSSFAPSLGNIMGAIYGGLVNDKYVTYKRKQFAGKFSPEMRSPMLLVTAVTGPIGLILFGCGTQYHVHWMLPLVGEFLMAFGSIVAGNITYTYVADTYLERADAALVILNGLKNLSAFGLVYAVTPWNTHSGYATAFGCLAVVLFTFHLPMAILYYKGYAIRSWQNRKMQSAQTGIHGAAFA